MDLLSPLQPTTNTASTSSTGDPASVSQDQQNAFLSAMTSALNRTSVLADADGDSDDPDDGTSLQVKIGS